MILSDLLTYLRARKGGVFYSDVADAVGLPLLRLVRAERTMTVPDLTLEELRRLAEYFEVPTDDLARTRLRGRGDLTSYLAAQEKANQPARLLLRGGSNVTGLVEWRDRHAVALLQPDRSSMVVYRSSVEEWGDR
jgi:transcriptional regulator with XRE-family HTH domain